MLEDTIIVIDVPLIVTDSLYALICLLGLDRSGNFLVENCTGASTYQSPIGMPIDAVASRVEAYPKDFMLVS